MEQQGKNSTVHAAAFGAAALIASQVAGKATRDAFFLSHFGVTSLPAMVIAASLLSIAAGLVTARLISSTAPSRLLPRAFMLSSFLYLVEWALSGWFPEAVAILVYLQMAILGTTLISGFWALLGDRFDAHSAKKQFSRIVAAGAFGGVVGGVLAERTGSHMGVNSLFPILACFHLVCSFIATALSRGDSKPVKAQRQTLSSFSVLGRAPYVRNLAVLLLFTTVGAGLLDYVFKARAAAAYSDGSELVRFFAAFYTVVGLATFVIQLLVSQAAVEKLGVVAAVRSLPLTLAFGSLGGLLVPGLTTAFAARGGEAVFRNSLFKSGYEMLYAAIPRRERRATKAILDVGVDRFGDLLSAVLLSVILFLVTPHATTVILFAAAALGFGAYWISRSLQRGYVQALENSLLSQSVSVVRTVMMTILNRALGQKDRPADNSPAGFRDALLESVRDLRSSDPNIVRAALRQSTDPALVAHIIMLLAWDEVSVDAIEALQRFGPRITGQLVDALLDPAQEFAIRRRIPRVLAKLDGQRAADGLLHGLSDDRFEVRVHSAKALSEIKERTGVLIHPELIVEAVGRELDVKPEARRTHRLIDGTGKESGETITMDHVFRLLGLIHSREPLRIAHRALRSADEHLKGTSLEYLENILPDDLWQRLLPLFEDRMLSGSVTTN